MHSAQAYVANDFFPPLASRFRLADIGLFLKPFLLRISIPTSDAAGNTPDNTCPASGQQKRRLMSAALSLTAPYLLLLLAPSHRYLLLARD